ncbi:type VI secretion system baseplate subunit TssG [Antarcticimicrobium sediminis]|uniref:Type VI secretion system baseplate subunit TssG n=1 Tax=Antarcticimicrobium sediminis TaxID=2546227 RepID=A0A4R5ERP0_9RHOB|nr:type VI secretion system baseplate subunit TssG [Antarcticimicrobium sediminis]TDE37505.1 type VI secretion system baseplate subunit TssG [Antarcticimicrobium sediminis]
MATRKGPGPDHLSHFDRLARDPEKHHVFQALRVIEAQFPEAPRLGESRRPRQDQVRLGQQPELSFPTSSIADFTPPQGDRPGRLTNRFFGLFGSQGPLPLHITEYVRDRLRNHRDPTFVAFADMLTHRMMSLLYRAWAAGQPAVSFDRGDDQMARQVAALSGYHGDHLQDRDAMPDLAKRYFSGLLAQGPKNAAGLEAMLGDFFGVPVTVQQFVGSWLELEPDDRWQLGAAAGLGQATSIGNRVWSRAAKFRLRIGPLSMADFDRLLPGGAALDRLRALVRTYAGDALDWDINLILAGDEVPRASLGGSTRLGHTSWIGSRRDEDTDRSDAEDLFLYPGAGADHHRPM